ncbi:hypothetical protein Sjap_008510 [Stephania japonica]|uniref:Cell division cycle 5-like protein n=1 Tax=Stephania japonica TaxID=461633 RepID=A0AAP0JPM4_9MAGN
MRIMIKGGVWKNTEDEILKAAVMKYGKNQWARISSLLVRKSAKQCKARWYEWLDPSIKKTEWTREEDEKLLHLAKLMPTQWRTIAPIETAAGEIDPNPESKPARPDPVDMDEDEKEMLSEARARLANTRGKKAKRKAREKQLEEARRLASLQKRRELKAAGIDTRQRKRKRKGIDYNAEIPFEKRPPPGFYDVADEDRPVEQPKFPTTIEEIEGKRRVDVEAQLRKQDVARNKIAQRQDAPSSILQVNKLNDPETVRKRSKLMLPAPQISDHELEEIAKMGYASDLVSGSDGLAEGSAATHSLLANYNQTPRLGMTPLRTPQRTPSGKGDAVMMEAENLARLRESQTPLLGGENPELHPSDFSGVTPKRRDIQTPNPMATPSSTPGPMGLTPRITMTPANDGYSFGMTPKVTPMRDELHINEDMDLHDNGRLELQRQEALRRNLRSGLTSLPQPRNEYQIVVQPVPEENEEPEDRIEEDMSDRMAREKAEEEARQQALLRKRSKVLQRELPRPPLASLELIRSSLMRADEEQSSFVPPTPIEQADELIRKELLTLLEHDNAKYPLDEKAAKEKKKGSKRASSGKSVVIPELDDIDEDFLKEWMQKGSQKTGKRSLQTPNFIVIDSKVEVFNAGANNLKEVVGGPEEEEENDGRVKDDAGRRHNAMLRWFSCLYWSSLSEGSEVEEEEADLLVNEEAKFLRVAMGHENGSVDDFVEAHDACLEDLMYFPTRNAYGLSSVAGNMEKLAALQNEFEMVKNRMDEETKKAVRLEQKIKLLTNGYQTRAGKIWSQIEATNKQIDTAVTELECFQSLQRQEQLAATSRINGLVEEITKQKDLEKNSQQRYGDLVQERERIQRLIEAYRLQAQLQEEIEARNHLEEIAAENQGLALSESAANQGELVGTEIPEPADALEETELVGTEVPEPADALEETDGSNSVDQSQTEAPISKEGASIEQATPASQDDMDADKQLNSVASMDVDGNVAIQVEKVNTVPGNGHIIPTTDENNQVPSTVTTAGLATENADLIPESTIEVTEMKADSGAEKVANHLDEDGHILNEDSSISTDDVASELKAPEAVQLTVAEGETEDGGQVLKPGENQEQMTANANSDEKSLEEATDDVSGAGTTEQVVSTSGGEKDSTLIQPSNVAGDVPNTS